MTLASKIRAYVCVSATASPSCTHQTASVLVISIAETNLSISVFIKLDNINSTIANIEFPASPATYDRFLHFGNYPRTPMVDLFARYICHNDEMRKIFAQQTGHPAINKPSDIPISIDSENVLKIRARNLEEE